MKRLPVAAAAVLLGTTVVEKEVLDIECKERSCANELTARVPNQPHTHQESHQYQETNEMVVLPSSPIVTVPRNSPGHREWIEKYGEQGARDIEWATKAFLRSE